jgi:hypothetical protein
VTRHTDVEDDAETAACDVLFAIGGPPVPLGLVLRGRRDLDPQTAQDPPRTSRELLDDEWPDQHERSA